MRIPDRVKLAIKYIGFLSFLLTANQSFTQDANLLLADSVKKNIRAISHSEISIQAAETIIQANRIQESLLSDKAISALKTKNDSIYKITDSLLAKDKNLELSTENIRSLNNKLVYWNQVSDYFEKEKQQFLSEMQSLDEKNNNLNYKISIWQKTLASTSSLKSDYGLKKRTEEVIERLDSLNALIFIKSIRLNRMLDKTSELGIEIAEHKNQIERALINQKGNVFVRQQKSLTSINYLDKDIWNIYQPLKSFYHLEIRQLLRYLKQNSGGIFFQILILIVLLFIFRRVRKSFIRGNISASSYYQSMLKKILSESISTAIILALFLSIIIFPNRPELFKDLTRLLVIAPLIIIARKVIEHKYHKYLYILIGLIIIQTGFFIFPPYHVFYRTSLLLVALIEIFTFWKLIRYFSNYKYSKESIRKSVLIFIGIHLGFSITGLFGAISGASILAELTLIAPILDAFLAILIVLTAIILNGLIQVSFQSAYLKRLNVVQQYGMYIEKKAILLINVAAFSLWLFSMLRILGLKTFIFGSLGTFFSFEMSVGVISFTLGGIIIFLAVIWFSIVLSKMVHIVLEIDILDKFNLAKGVPHTIAMLVRYTLITLGVLFAVGAAGLPLQNFTILFGAFGVGIGFGLQNIFNNLVSGLILLFERPIQIGDTIEVGELIGNVKSIGIRSSNVRTFDGAEVIVPNGQLISNEVVNWTLSDQQRRIEVIVGVAYGTDPHKVKAVLSKHLEEHPDIIKDPKPNVLFSAMGESSLDFRLLFWTSNVGEWLRIKSEVTFMAHDSLKKEGIEIPFPQRDLHLKSVAPGIEFVKK